MMHGQKNIRLIYVDQTLPTLWILPTTTVTLSN